MASKNIKQYKPSFIAFLSLSVLLISSFILIRAMYQDQRMNMKGRAFIESNYQVIKQNIIAKDTHKIFTRICNKYMQEPGLQCDPWFEVTQTMVPIMPAGTYPNQIGGYAFYDSLAGIWKYRRFVLESNIKNPKLQNLWWQLCPIDANTGPLWGQCSNLTKIKEFSDWLKGKGFMNNVVSSYNSFASQGSDGYYRFVHFMMGQGTKDTILYGRACTMIPNLSGEMQDCSQWIRLTDEEASWKENCPGDPVCAANGRFRSYGVYPYEENGVSYVRKVAIARDGTRIFGDTCVVPSKITWSDTAINWQGNCTGWSEIDLLPELRSAGIEAVDTFDIYKFGLDVPYHVLPSTQP